MMFGEIMDRFVEQSAASVMFRGTLENVVTAELLDEMFVATAKRQRPGELLFSSVVDLLAMVASGSRKSVNDAYLAKKEQFTVSVASVYNKLNGVETEVSRQLVFQTGTRMAEVVRRLGPRRTPLLRGYRTKIVDGNHLAATEHRIDELRYISAGPVPGFALVVLQPDLMLATDVFPCEDGHAQERSVLPQVLPTVQTRRVLCEHHPFESTRTVLREHPTTALPPLHLSLSQASRATATPETDRRRLQLWRHGRNQRVARLGQEHRPSPRVRLQGCRLSSSELSARGIDLLS